MSDEETRDAVLAILDEVVPGAALEELDGDSDLREELDMDSLDVLHFVAALSERYGIAVPEADYPRLLTVDGCVAYVTEAASRAER